MTKVVHCMKEKYDIYIGRPSLFGNPFSDKEDTLAKYKVGSREEAIEKYKEYILGKPELLNSLHELKNKVLGCWCRPNRCHGDILIELMDEYAKE